jgi:hypothetical protein
VAARTNDTAAIAAAIRGNSFNRDRGAPIVLRRDSRQAHYLSMIDDPRADQARLWL